MEFEPKPRLMITLSKDTYVFLKKYSEETRKPISHIIEELVKEYLMKKEVVKE
ncbi:hypothetical protein [Sulfolobus spindle-shaped virus]|nr:hypothetical protein [Sulfolobus spindle-shaped virus]AZG03152.1 hypothetical protein [Sulfolobus spindle-shaped virus]AZG03211.1 hypothetical protein [Sulfolobus spindle-shaped virus]AZG03329.1 hypothetical protein [Sulfolobus spindle-shaped virus]AZG03496.1 hypothetical protein [Sulfolobus spindle-shaped virus]